MRKHPFYVITGELIGVKTWIVCVCLESEEAKFKVDKLNQQRNAFMAARHKFDVERAEAAEQWRKRFERAPSDGGSIMYSGVSGITFGMSGGTVLGQPMTPGQPPLITASYGPAPWVAPPPAGMTSQWGSATSGMRGPGIGGGSGPNSPEAKAAWLADDVRLRDQLRALVDKLGMMDRRFSWVRRDRLIPTYAIEETTDDPHTESIGEDW